jgi:hypothetical protein
MNDLTHIYADTVENGTYNEPCSGTRIPLFWPSQEGWNLQKKTTNLQKRTENGLIMNFDQAAQESDDGQVTTAAKTDCDGRRHMDRSCEKQTGTRDGREGMSYFGRQEEEERMNVDRKERGTTTPTTTTTYRTCWDKNSCHHA